MSTTPTSWSAYKTNVQKISPEAASRSAKKVIAAGNDKIRQLLEECNDCQGFVMQHSISGGTGSGLATLILESIQKNYQKKAKFGFEIFGGEPGEECAQRTNVQVYNELLTTSGYLENILDMSVPFDNNKVGEIMKKKFSIKPSFSQMNCYMAKIISSITAPLRFNTDVYMGSILDDTVGRIPKLHFMTCSLAPVTKDQDTASKSLAAYAVDPENMTINYPNFDKDANPYEKLVFRWRGDLSNADANAAVQGLVDASSVTFNTNARDAIRMSIHGKQAAIPDDELFGEPDLAVAMIGNNFAIKDTFGEMCMAYDKLYSQKAFVHHLVDEGMEESDLSDARDGLGYLQRDYKDVSEAR